MQTVLTFAFLATLLASIYAQQSISGSLSHGGFTGTGTYGGRNNWGVGGSYSSGGHTFGGNYHSSGRVGANYGYQSGNHNFGASVSRGPGGTNFGASYSFRFDDDDEFLNWDKVNLGCTVNCAVYWRCVYSNFQDPAAQISCQKPSGCVCDKFADDDDEKLNWKKLGDKIDKGIDYWNKYKEIRDILRSDDDEIYRPTGPFRPWTPSPTFPTIPRPVLYDDDEKINWKKIGQKLDKGIEIYNKYKQIRDTLRSDDDEGRYGPGGDDDEFLNFGNINLGCTVSCGVYWRCVYANFKDPAAQISCQKPSGCNCDSFADDDDEKLNWKKLGNKIDKGIDYYNKYKQIRDLLRSDDDMYRPAPGGPIRPWTPSPTFPTIPRGPIFYDDDEKIARKIKRGVSLYKKGVKLYKKYRDVLRPTGDSEDDLKFKVGKLLKKGARAYKKGASLYKKYRDIRSQIGADDDMDAHKLRRLADKQYRRGKKAFGVFRRIRRALRKLREKKEKTPTEEPAVAEPAVEPTEESATDDDTKVKAASLLKHGLELYRKFKESKDSDEQEAQG